MENALYTAVVLGNLLDNNASAPGVAASAIKKLYEIDRQLAEMAAEEDRSGIDHTDASERLMDQAQALLETLPLAHKAELFYSDEQAPEQSGRLRLEIPGTPWDADAPLYFF